MIDPEATVDRRSNVRAATIDRRRASRQRVLLSAVAVNEDFNASFRCTIRDIGAGGARLSMPEGQLVPARFWLISVTSGLAFEAATAWRRYPLIGTTLGLPIEVDEPLCRLSRRLHKFWMAAVN
ncbi:MAG: PilZ domain-containing protein [Hyphomonadaceae bacterium]|nr:PilZ domain-containing protein [Hyphomonadaceae bacterium]